MEIATILIVLWFIFSHWIADFVFQGEKWALSKKKNFVSLIKHTATYTGIMFIAFFNILPLQSLFLFALGAFITHTAIDYFTSKIVSKKFTDKYLGGPIPNICAFTMIGLDQVLHYVTMLFLLYYCYNL